MSSSFSSFFLSFSLSLSASAGLSLSRFSLSCFSFSSLSSASSPSPFDLLAHGLDRGVGLLFASASVGSLPAAASSRFFYSSACILSARDGVWVELAVRILGGSPGFRPPIRPPTRSEPCPVPDRRSSASMNASTFSPVESSVRRPLRRARAARLVGTVRPGGAVRVVPDFERAQQLLPRRFL